jgi:PHIKZ066
MAMRDVDLDKILTNRTTTSFGVSIGTGLMLESVFKPTHERYDTERVIPTHVDLKNYDGWLINGYTLLRNIVTACKEPIEADTLTSKNIERIMEEIETEWAIIQSLLLSNNLDENFIMLFVPKYEKLIKRFNISKDTSVKYITNNETIHKLFRQPLMSTSEQIAKLTTVEDKVVAPYAGFKYLLTSHYTLDLLQSNKWTLLESHTGVLKDRHLWYTKYHAFGTNDLSHLPMVDLLLFMLGDDQLVVGMPRKIKSELYKVSIEKKWTFRTTRDKIKSDLNANPILAPMLKLYKL